MIHVDDKRNFYRMLVNSEVTVTIVDEEVNSSFSATCRDLSATGVAVEFENPVELDTKVKVHIDSSNPSIPSLHVDGKVVRCKEEAPDRYLVGITIDDLK